MSIRIRVYPQPHSIGARHNRARRRQQQQVRQQFAWQQQLLRQQMQQRMFGMGGIGGFGVGAGVGFPGQFPPSPFASSWGVRPLPAPAFAPIGAAWTGAYSVPGAYGSAFASPVGSYGSYGSYGSNYAYGSHGYAGVGQHGYDNC